MPLKMRFFNVAYFFAAVINIPFGNFELVVNVKTKSGKFIQQHLMADPGKDIVIIEYKMPKGTKTVTLFDFTKVDFQLFHLT